MSHCVHSVASEENLGMVQQDKLRMQQIKKIYQYPRVAGTNALIVHVCVCVGACVCVCVCVQYRSRAS